MRWIIREVADDEVANTSVIRNTEKSTEKAARPFHVLFVTLQVIGRMEYKFTWQGSTTTSRKQM